MTGIRSPAHPVWMKSCAQNRLTDTQRQSWASLNRRVNFNSAFCSKFDRNQRNVSHYKKFEETDDSNSNWNSNSNSNRKGASASIRFHSNAIKRFSLWSFPHLRNASFVSKTFKSIFLRINWIFKKIIAIQKWKSLLQI